MEIRNARIASTDISNEDHGHLTVWLNLDYGGAGQGFGGYALYSNHGWGNGEKGNYAGRFINRVLEITEVSHWDRVAGKTIRVRIEDGLIKGIGNILKEDWFVPSIDFADRG